MVASSGHMDFMPLSKCRRLYVDTSNQVTTAYQRGKKRVGFVIIKVEIVLERIGADDVIVAFRKAEDDPAGSVLTSRDGFETHVNSDIGVGTARCDDDVELFVGGSLDQRLATLRGTRHVFNLP